MKLLADDDENCNTLVATFELELEDDEDFDPEKLDFFQVNRACSGDDEIIAEAFDDDVVLLNLLRYGNKIYQNCGENDGFVEGEDEFTDVKEATVDCSSDNLDL